MDRRIPPERAALSGRIPLAVVLVDSQGLVSHWSSGAGRLFGQTREEAIGRPVADLLPVAGALTAREETGEPIGPALDFSLTGGTHYPTAGRAHVSEAADGPLVVLWWAYPLVGPGAERLLLLLTDVARIDIPANTSCIRERLFPGFALHTDFPDADQLSERLPDILPNMGPTGGSRVVSQILELGYPVLEISRYDRVPVTPDWGVPRYLERRGRLRATGGIAPRDGEEAPEGSPPKTTAETLGGITVSGAEVDFADDASEALHHTQQTPDEPPDLEYAAVRERLEFLNEVSGRIGSSLDLARTIREVTSAACPRFADFAGTHLRAQVLAGEGFPDGPPDVTTVWHRVWVEHNDEPGRWDDTVPVGEAIAFPEHTPFFQCMVTGEPVLIERISDELGDRISAQFEKRDLRPLINRRSILIVPLKARNVVLGFMVLLRRADREPFNDMDRVTGAELAARAGLVLDNARMYTFQETIAETLQDRMLPRISPRIGGCDVTTRYLPGERLGRVGGDWFDAVRLPGSRVALVVGDVMGHGLNSAAMMGQLRTAVQTMAALDLPPAQLLRNLDDLAQRLGDHYLATCLYAVYDPIRSEILIANAGHIPPVLVRAADGRSELLELPTGAPIGVGGVPFETVAVPVSAGDRLVLCTDGLVEVRGQDIGIGLAALCESAAHPASSMDDACEAIIRSLKPRGGRSDDVALLMARLNGIPPSHVATWRFAARPQEVARARRLTGVRMRDWGLASMAESTQFLVGELFTNAVRHARTERIDVRLVRADALLCEVTDEDQAAPVLLGSGPDDEFGRGLRIVDRLARTWGSSRTSTGRGKTVWFEQNLPAGTGGLAGPTPSARAARS
jgi:serine phosphatase RsbU (regulator of sigma subunit)